MGNEYGNPASKLGITSLAATTPNIERNELEKFAALIKKTTAEKENPDRVHKDEIAALLKQVDKFGASDVDLFNQLFLLFDEEGRDTVDYKAYLIGSFACLTSGTAAERLQWCLSLLDIKNTGHNLRSDMKKLLLSINSTAAYFGDPVLTPREIDLFTIDMFKQLPNVAGRGIPHGECIEYLLKHPFILQFIHGEGTISFGSPELQV